MTKCSAGVMEGFVMATTFLEVQRMSDNMAWGGRRGDLGAFRDSSRLIPLHTNFHL